MLKLRELQYSEQRIKYVTEFLLHICESKISAPFWNNCFYSRLLRGTLMHVSLK